MALFKSRERREAERRLKIRRAKARLSQQVNSLRTQRDKYVAQGEEAARQGKTDKVRQFARAILQFKAMEKRFQDILLTLELFEAQKEMMSIQSDFVVALKACASSIRDSAVVQDLAKLEAEFEKATMLTEQANETMDVFLQSSPETLSAGADAAPAEELAALERDMMQCAAEREKDGVPDAIASDIQSIERELKKEV